MNAEQIMTQVQVFASAWALVGGRFDNGDMLETANEEKAELKTAIEALVQERDALKLRLLETVNVFAKEFDRHRAECDTYQVEADKLAAENKVLRDAWSAEPVGYISEHEKDSAMDKFRYLPSKMYPTPVYTRNQS
jgi:hypothetical protein